MFRILTLVRWRSILYAAFMMYAMRYLVIGPLLKVHGGTFLTRNGDFTLLILSVCCLIAAAHVINDYFDTKADRISGIKNVVVGRVISRRCAIFLHTVLNTVAIGTAFYLGIKVGVWEIGILFLLISGMLWFYSSRYKRYFLVGNLLVALLAAAIPLGVLLFEVLVAKENGMDAASFDRLDFPYILRWVGGFSFFVFLNTLMYEVNKDIYTAKGDAEDGNRTIPVKKGTKSAVCLIGSLGLLGMVVLLGLYFTLFSSFLLLSLYLGIGLFIPYLIYTVSVWSGRRNRKFQLGLIRLIMVLCMAFGFGLPEFFR